MNPLKINIMEYLFLIILFLLILFILLLTIIFGPDITSMIIFIGPLIIIYGSLFMFIIFTMIATILSFLSDIILTLLH